MSGPRRAGLCSGGDRPVLASGGALVAMTTQLVTNALLMAVWRRGKPDTLLHHSDQGSQGIIHGRRNTLKLEVAMNIARRRSARSGRASLPSPGRPPVAGRDKQNRFWRAIPTGLSSEDAALEAGVSQPVGTRLFRKAGGMPPAIFRSSAKPLPRRYLSLAEPRRSRFSGAGPFHARDWTPPRSGRFDNLP